MTNQQLFEQHIIENLNSAYRFAYTYTKNQEDAEDVVNESVVKALKSVHSLKNPTRLKTWFYRIIINTAISYIKRNKSIVYLNPMDMAEMNENSEQLSDIGLEQMIDMLDPKYKSIVVLRYFEDMTLEDIALTLNENVSTIKTRLYKALKILRIEMEEVL